MTIPLYHPMNIVLGFGLLVVTVLIHMLALMALRQRLHRLRVSSDNRRHLMQESMVATVLVLVLSFVHILEVVVWGGVYAATGAIDSIDDAFYFSMTTYTTVGPSGVDILPGFRGLAGFESLIGPIMVAWSTAFLVESVAHIRMAFQAMQKHQRPQ